jgi:hypothetical protein
MSVSRVNVGAFGAIGTIVHYITPSITIAITPITL